MYLYIHEEYAGILVQTSTSLRNMTKGGVCIEDIRCYRERLVVQQMISYCEHNYLSSSCLFQSGKDLSAERSL